MTVLLKTIGMLATVSLAGVGLSLSNTVTPVTKLEKSSFGLESGGVVFETKENLNNLDKKFKTLENRVSENKSKSQSMSSVSQNKNQGKSKPSVGTASSATSVSSAVSSAVSSQIQANTSQSSSSANQATSNVIEIDNINKDKLVELAKAKNFRLHFNITNRADLYKNLPKYVDYPEKIVININYKVFMHCKQGIKKESECTKIYDYNSAVDFINKLKI